MIKKSIKMIVSIISCAYIAQYQSLTANKKDPVSGVFSLKIDIFSLAGRPAVSQIDWVAPP
jgi:hypothetical protein